jgi:hypothetical protein
MGGRAAGLAVFAVFAAIYQRSTSRPPRKSWAADGLAISKTARQPAVRPLFFAVFMAQMQQSHDVITNETRFWYLEPKTVRSPIS